jgi:uncharacterized protein YbaA (DUF1428 family)
MAYADGFVIPVPRRKIKEYIRISRKAGKVWRELGALDYKECVGDDLKLKGHPASFLRLVKPKPGEAIVFSWILYKSRAHRDRVNKKVMSDPRIANMMDPKDSPFDMRRMVYGGFRVIVDV